MLYENKYKPTTQKSLFNKNVVVYIKKWLSNLESYTELDNVKQILFLHGPVACGKSVTIDLILKSYNIIDIDPLEIRISDKIEDILQGIVGFKDITLNNIEKWNHKNKRDKYNIVLIDNVELCDKNIVSFIETVYNKANINVPIICIGNNTKSKELFSDFKNCSSISFEKPSLLELVKLTSEINTNEKLNLSKDNIKTIIEFTQFDIRQLFHTIEQWKHSRETFENFLSNLQVKHIDTDLIDKVQYMTDSSQKFDIRKTFNMSTSEPITISNSLFQNYNNIYTEPHENELDIAVSVLDNISWSNMLYNDIYENQLWELYDVYTMASCVIPSHSIKQNKQKITNIPEKILPYRDVSHNFLNSYGDIKELVINSALKKSGSSQLFINNEWLSFFNLSKMFQTSINDVCEYFDKNKKKKNTSKQEKLELCKSITGGQEKISIDFIINNVYIYNLFEVNLDIMSKKELYYNEENIIKNLNKIDLRILKRFINIFSIADNSKILKSHIEMTIQYKLFIKLIDDIKIQSKNIKPQTQIENLTQELSDVWNLK